MPRHVLGSLLDTVIGVEYANNGKASAIYAVVPAGGSAVVAATLADGRTVEASFPAGDTKAPLPANAVSIAFDATGEATYTGLARLTARG